MTGWGPGGAGLPGDPHQEEGKLPGSIRVFFELPSAGTKWAAKKLNH
jgi:hypothetical protein